MRIVGVIDLLGGVAVRAVGGRRHEYRPVVSRLCPSANPVAVARGYRQPGLTELYVADLDAIAGRAPALSLYESLRHEGFSLWVDAGVRDLAGARTMAGVERVVIGLETLASVEELGRIVASFGDRVVLSLDLRQNAPVSERRAWPDADARRIAADAVALGVRRLLVLDLARVGMGRGTGTEALCAALASAYPEVEIACGGGVRHRDDLLRLKEYGVRAVLLASALHDGLIGRADLEGL